MKFFIRNVKLNLWFLVNPFHFNDTDNQQMHITVEVLVVLASVFFYYLKNAIFVSSLTWLYMIVDS